MPDFETLLNVQCMMFILMGIGLLLCRLGILGPQQKKGLSDLVLNVVLPCNIVNSFRIAFNREIFLSFSQILLVSVLVQLFCLLLSRLLYRRLSPERRAVLTYATICSNAGLIGNPVAEGLYGAQGLLYASIYLVPQRVVMWSAGLHCFTRERNYKRALRRAFTHPCILAVLLGLLFMLTQLQLPAVLDRTLKSLSGCNTALSMIAVGAILGEVNPREAVNRQIAAYTLLRLIGIPLVVFSGCLLAGLSPIVTGVSVILAAMPAGSTTAILAASYQGDAAFASKCVFFSTLCSLLSVPLWCAALLLAA